MRLHQPALNISPVNVSYLEISNRLNSPSVHVKKTNETKKLTAAEGKFNQNLLLGTKIALFHISNAVLVLRSSLNQAYHLRCIRLTKVIGIGHSLH